MSEQVNSEHANMPSGKLFTRLFRRAARQRCGFTLIELLVVIAIISLLVSILLPSLSRAKALAQTVLCSNNLKQVGVCMSMFASEHKGLVGLQSYGGPDTSLGWLQYLDGRGSIETFRRTPTWSRTDPEIDIASVSVCPAFHPFTNESGTDNYVYGAMRGGFETDIYAFSPPETDAQSRIVNFDKVEDASNYWLLTDSYTPSIDSQIYVIYPDCGTGSGGIHLRHNGRASALFVDGHVGSLGAEEFRDSPYTPATAGYSESGEKFPF